METAFVVPYDWSLSQSFWVKTNRLMLVWPRCVSWGLQAFLIFKENWLDLPKSQPLGSSMPSPGFQGIAQGLRSYLSPLTSSYCSIELSVIAHLQSSTVISTLSTWVTSLISTQNTYAGHSCTADLTETFVPWRGFAAQKCKQVKIDPSATLPSEILH